MTQPAEAPPIACTLGADDYRARREWIAAVNAAGLREVRRDGLRLELTYALEARADVLELVRREQACCAFLSFQVHDDADAVRLTVTAPQEALGAEADLFDAIQAGAFQPKACGCTSC